MTIGSKTSLFCCFHKKMNMVHNFILFDISFKIYVFIEFSIVSLMLVILVRKGTICVEFARRNKNITCSTSDTNIRMPWWRHQMGTFSALLALCAGNSPVSGEFPLQRPVTRSFDVLSDLRLNKRLGKQSWRWWFETPSRSLWRHHNGRYLHHDCVEKL